MMRRLIDMLWTVGTLALIPVIIVLVILASSELRRHAAYDDDRGAEEVCQWCPARGDEPHAMRFVWADEGPWDQEDGDGRPASRRGIPGGRRGVAGR